MRDRRSVWVGLALLAWALGSALRAQDTIRYTDAKAGKESTATGSIQEENAGGIVYKPGTGAGTRKIGALDIVDIEYEVPGKVKLLQRSATGDEKKATNVATREAERRTALAEAVKNYQAVLLELDKAKYKFAERHLQYKIAQLQARQAEDDPALAEAAIDALGSFMKNHPDGWQISRCARLLARLQLGKGDAEGARKTYGELSAVANLPKPVRQECDFLIADALIQARKFADAEKKLQAVMQGLEAEDPLAARGKIYLAECQATSKLPEAVAQIEGIIAKTTDKGLLGTAYNALGDCYRLNGRNKDALWQYLWVDVIYHQDKQEHVKAMDQLAKLFDELGDKARAKQYRDKLKKEIK